jgi:hypothetical protein
MAPALELVRGPWERANALYYRHTSDSRAATAPPHSPAHHHEARDDEEAFERAGAVGPVPGELGGSGTAGPAP